MFSIQNWKNWYYGKSDMTQKKELKENPPEEEKSLQQVVPSPSSPKLYNTPTVNKPIYPAKSTYYKKSSIRSKAYCPT